jgi:glutathionylspermidine synthase
LSQDYDQLTHKVKEYKKIKAWIVKPGRGRMGEGIKIISDLEQILKEYKNKSREELVLS